MIDPAIARYRVPLQHRATGERRAIVVTLPRAARLEASRNVALRGSGGCAWPVAHTRAIQTAHARMPEYEWSGDAVAASAPPALRIVSNTAAPPCRCVASPASERRGPGRGGVHETAPRRPGKM